VGSTYIHNVGQIVFDEDNHSIKRYNNTFVTTETILNTQTNTNSDYKIESTQMDGYASEPIPVFSCITWKSVGKLGLATFDQPTGTCIGIAIENMNKGDVKKFVTRGFVTNLNWNFTDPPNTPIWVGSNGGITTSPPNLYSMQRVGRIVNTNTIFVDIKEIILLNG
jgi:hypothetical protein